MKTEDKDALLSEMDALMRSLRQCETQATAIAWMTRAYNAMDGATRMVKDMERMVREERDEARGLIFHIPKPRLEIVQTIPQVLAHRPARSETVIYPEVFVHPGLKPLPKAWTRLDTRRLEQENKRRIVRLGK